MLNKTLFEATNPPDIASGYYFWQSKQTRDSQIRCNICWRTISIRGKLSLLDDGDCV